MFAWWGRMVYRFRYIVIGVMVALCLGGGVYGSSLGQHVTQSGFYDDSSESVRASVLADEVYGRDRTSHVVAVLTPPGEQKVTDKAWQTKVTGELDQVVKDNPQQIVNWIGWLKAPDNAAVANMKTDDLRHTFVSIPLKGDDDDTILKNYQAVEPALQKINGGDIQLAGLNPLASELTGTIGTDQKRAEIAIIPLVAIVLFFVFGGVIAAALPAIIGGLTIGGALGILRFTAEFGPVHFFAQPVVTMMGFGIAVDYGLFIVSRFREELAEGYDTPAAVRRAVMTSGRTVAFSAVIIVASSLPLLLIPLGFLKSITYAIIASVLLAAFLSITVLPATLAVLGPNIDALGVRTLLRVPFLANWPFSRRIIDWFAEKTQKTKTRAEIENGFWGRLVNMVMKRPVAFAAPILIGMTLLVIPIGQLALGGLSEKYLPPDNHVRVAQQEFDNLFHGFRTEPLTMVIKSTDGKPVTDDQLDEIRAKAEAISGFEGADDPATMWKERSVQDGASKDPSVRVLSNGLVNKDDAPQKIDELRALQAPHGTTLLIGGTSALAQDSIQSLYDRLPLMVVILVITTTILMFLAFGSLVLPIKAAVMSALTLGSTMGILTWMFVEGGHGSGLFNYTPQPLLAPMIGLIIAVIWGLSTDYEVFLVSRMVEARERGMSTQEAIRIGTATTGRLITGAALVLAVVAGSFVFSDLVVMKYLAFGLLIALLLDATVIRMFLVPAVMKLLGDDCWWAPRWMKRVQDKIGLGEVELPDEKKRPVAVAEEPALVGAGAPLPRQLPPHDPTHPGSAAPAPPRPAPRSAPVADESTVRLTPGPQHVTVESEAPTTRFASARSAVRSVVAGAANAVTQRQTATPAPPAGEREIETWLGDLRHTTEGAAPQQYSASNERTEALRPAADQIDSEATTAIPIQHATYTYTPAAESDDSVVAGPRARGTTPLAEPDDAATRAIPVSKTTSDTDDSQAATERVNARGENQPEHPARPQRGGDSVSAQDLLRREGRL